jgi:hypothetical protein
VNTSNTLENGPLSDPIGFNSSLRQNDQQLQTHLERLSRAFKKNDVHTSYSFYHYKTIKSDIEKNGS